MDPNTLNLDPDPEFSPILDPDPVRNYVISFEKKKKIKIIFEKNFFLLKTIFF